MSDSEERDRGSDGADPPDNSRVVPAPPPPINSQFTYEMKSPRARALWVSAVSKIKSRRAIQSVSEEILLYGTSTQLTDQNNQYKQNIDQLIEMKKSKQDTFRRFHSELTCSELRVKWLLHPNGWFRSCWNPLMAGILVYTATVMPFRVAFAEDVYWDFLTTFEFTIDCLFAVDIFVNFFSATVKADGRIETNRRVIARKYLRSWFVLDLLACVPFDFINYSLDNKNQDDPSSSYNNFVRLLRLPRLYKLLRVFRIIKALRAYGKSGLIEKMQDLLHINSRLFKLFKFLMYVLITVHIMACFWYFSARLEGFGPETWVSRCGFIELTDMQKYLRSFYWAVTTVVTVGYGDIVAVTQMEKILAILWMIAGGGFYSYTVGSMSSFLTSIDTRETIMAQKIATVQELATQASLSSEIRTRVRDAIRYNTMKTGNIWSDKHSLFSELPKDLRYEVATTMYGGVVKDIYIFKHKEKAFVNYIMPLLKPMHVGEAQFLFRQGEYPDEVFFITFGRVNYVVMPKEVVFKSYLKGSYVGEIEIFKNVARIYTAIAMDLSELLVLSKADFLALLTEFPNERLEMVRIARERIRKDKQAYFETLELLRLRQVKGDLQDLAGKGRVLTVEFDCEEQCGEEEDETDIEVEELRKEADAMKDMMENVWQEVREIELLTKAYVRQAAAHRRQSLTSQS